MTFLNVALLGGAAAFLVPLVIHLLNRSRFQVVPWAAMHLLDFSLPQNARRFEWRSLLLLLIRCLIPIVLALCMARPLWTWWQSLASGAVDNAVLLLDNSVSMEARLPARLVAENPPDREALSTAFSYAARQAQEIAERSRDDGRFALIPLASRNDRVRTSAGITSLPYVSRADLENASRSASVDTNPVDILQSLQTAIATAQSFRRSTCGVVLISDFRASDWQSVNDEALAELQKRMQGANARVSLTMLQVPVVETPNHSVHFLADQPLFARVGQPLELSVVVRNDTSDPSGPLPVIAQVDGADLGTKQATLPAHGQAQVSFVCQFEQPGQHQVEVRIKDDLPIAGDNTTRMTLTVLPRLQCLIIDDSNASELLQRDSGFLQLALGGTRQASANASRPFEVTAIRVDELNTEVLTVANIIVLANLARLPRESAEAIARHVSEGAHLVLFPGERVDREWYAATWGPDSAHPLLPGTWSASQQVAATASSITVRTQNWEHPALRLFNTQTNGQLGRIEFRQYWPLSLAVSTTASNTSTQSANTATPMAWLSNDEPWLATRSFGRGHVLQCATTCGTTGSNWPLRPSFVPAVQRLLSAPFDNLAVVGDTAARESELPILPAERLDQIAAALGAQRCDSAEGFLSTIADNSNGRELWQPLLWLTVILLMGEVLLQKFLTRGPR